MNHVWIVEMLIKIPHKNTQQWAPLLGMGLTKLDAEQSSYDYKHKNPNARFRVRKYVSMEEQ